MRMDGAMLIYLGVRRSVGSEATLALGASLLFHLDWLKKQGTIFNMKLTRRAISHPQQILRRLARKGKGWAFTPHDFADLGDPRSIGMALTRLMRDGKIRRVGRGLYDCPHPHPILGQTGATSDAVVSAVARNKNLRLLPSKAVAANRLGLNTQVPAQMVYHTDAAPARVDLGKLKIVFRRNSGRNLALAGRPSGLVAQALRDVGKDHVKPHHLKRIRDHLSAIDRKRLKQDVTLVPAWMRPHFQELARTDG
jgi:hypothetical protein